jgi:anti-sigma factor RsiW
VDPVRDPAGADEDACERLRERHGDYLDGLLPIAELAQVQSHLEECDSCARYDRVVRRGLDVARGLPDLRISDDFELRLQHRLFHMQDASALGQPLAGVGVAATLAIVIALIAWSPFLLLQRTPTTPTTSVVAEPEVMMAALPPSDPLGTVAVGWYPGQISALLTQPRLARPTIFPGPYSPLIVNPPVQFAPMRMTSTEPRTLE